MILKAVRTVLLILFFLGFAPYQSFTEPTWQDETLGLTDEAFYSIAEDPGRKATYLGASGGAYKKADGETGWRQVFACRGQYKGVNYILTDTGGNIYIATKNGLYKSTNYGADWQRLFKGVNGENDCTYISGNPENNKVFYLGTGKGLFWTEDSGRTWKRAFGELSRSAVSSMAFAKTPKGRVLFIVSNNEAYRADALLENYEKVFGCNYRESQDTEAEENEDEENGELGFLAKNILAAGDIIYLVTNRGLFASGDWGMSWSKFNSEGLAARDMNDAAVTEEAEIFAATRKGVFKYSKDQKTWIEYYYGMDDRVAEKLMLAKDKGLWVLCRRRVYKMGSNVFSAHKKSFKVNEVMAQFENEPTINEVIKMAIDYAEVSPEKIKNWRKGAKFRAILPKVNFGIDHGVSDTYEIYTASSGSYWVYGPRDNTDGWDLNFSWDLADLIWNPEQTSIDVRSKLMVQLRDDILDEVTRAYFERRRLQIEGLLTPSDDLPFLLKKRLRVEELTATIDGLTGGRFSAAIEKANTN